MQRWFFRHRHSWSSHLWIYNVNTLRKNKINRGWSSRMYVTCVNAEWGQWPLVWNVRLLEKVISPYSLSVSRLHMNKKPMLPFDLNSFWALQGNSKNLQRIFQRHLFSKNIFIANFSEFSCSFSLKFFHSSHSFWMISYDYDLGTYILIIYHTKLICLFIKS